MKKTFRDELKEIKKSFDAALEAIENSFIDKISKLNQELITVQEKQEELTSECAVLHKENSQLRLELDRLDQARNARKVVLGGEVVSKYISKSKGDLQLAAERLLEKELEVEPCDLNVIHVARLGSRVEGKPDTRPLLVEAGDSFLKHKIFKKVIQRRSRSIYVAEFLTQRRRRLLESLLKLKKAHPTKIKRAFSKHGVVTLIMSNSDKEIRINTEGDLDRCARQLISDVKS